MIKFAPHQKKGISQVIEGFETYKNICVISPTGSGKTPTFGAIAKHYSDQGKKVCILTDREDLLDQGDDTLSDMFDVNTKKITAATKKLNAFALKEQKINVFVAMVETLFNRLKNPLWSHFFSSTFIFIIDECHEARFRKLINHEALKDCHFLGFTATPIYSQKKLKLSDDYEQAYILATEKELIDEGFLVKPRTVSLPVDNNNVQKNSSGEYNPDDVMRLQNQYVTFDTVINKYFQQSQEFIEYLKEHNPNHYYQKYDGKPPHVKAIFYGVNSAHVLSIYNAFKEVGINCDFILSDTKIQTKKERKETVKKFKDDKITVLINCQITTKGFDSKNVVLIGKLFLTTSLAKDNQVGGRCVRVTEAVHGINTKEERLEMIAASEKPYAIIIDYLGNYKLKHNGEQRGVWYTFKDWIDIFENGQQKKKGEALTKQCPKCDNQVPANSKICKCEVLNPKNFFLEPCGYQFPQSDKVDNRKEIEELIVIDEQLNSKKIPKELKNKAYSQMTFEELDLVRDVKGFSFPWMLYQIKTTKGEKGLNDFAAFKGYKSGYIENQKKLDRIKFQAAINAKFQNSPFKNNDIIKVKNYFMKKYEEHKDFYFALNDTRDYFKI